MRLRHLEPRFGLQGIGMLGGSWVVASRVIRRVINL